MDVVVPVLVVDFSVWVEDNVESGADRVGLLVDC